MDIKEQFNLIAQEYDCNRKKFIPCFEDYYVNTTKFLASNIRQPKKILDLGAGTGLLSYYWYQHFPKSEFLLVDIAEDMLSVAKKRFSGIETVKYKVLDYEKAFPKDKYDIVMSALSIHHLENKNKENLFSQIYNSLSDGCMFVNYDQFSAGTPEMNTWYDSYWERQLTNRGLSQRDIELWKERRKLDRECSVEEETAMLQKAGFKEVKCVYSNQKFSVILAVK